MSLGDPQEAIGWLETQLGKFTTELAKTKKELTKKTNDLIKTEEELTQKTKGELGGKCDMKSRKKKLLTTVK